MMTPTWNRAWAFRSSTFRSVGPTSWPSFASLACRSRSWLSMVRRSPPARDGASTWTRTPSRFSAPSAASRPRPGSGWAPGGADDWDHVFTRAEGSSWHPDRLTVEFDREVEKAGLPRIRLPDLRHSHCTHLLASGANPQIVSERLGHSSVSFTLDVDGHLLPGQQADAAAAIAKLVGV